MAVNSDPPQERIRIFNNKGRELCEFRASVQRSWVIGAEGRATFNVSNLSQVADEDYLQFGNWLLVESSSLPAWAGMIDVPREWSGRVITVNAFTPERQFLYRVGELEKIISGSAGSIFKELIYLVNTAERTPIRAGTIYTGTAREETLHPVPLSESLKRIANLSGEEYEWIPSVGGDGALVITGNWSKSIGLNSSIELTEGKGGGNIEGAGALMIEDEPLVNSIVGYGDADTWASRPVSNKFDSTSVAKYGKRQAGVNFRTTEQGTLDANTIQFLNKNKQPQRLFRVSALNSGDTFYAMRLGNRMKLRLQSCGFGGVNATVRIMGMYYDPVQGQKIELVLQEV